MHHQTSAEPAPLLDRAVALWRKAQLVHQSPSWEGRPEARAIAEALASRHEFEAGLIALLADPSPLVVAYSLLTLDLMGSGLLREVSPTLIASRARVTLQFGSVRQATEIGRFARDLLARAPRGAAEVS